MRSSALFASTAALIIALFAYCSTQNGENSTGPGNIEDRGNEIALDNNSRVTNVFTVMGPSGEILTIDSGTVILRKITDETWEAIPAKAKLTITLSSTGEKNVIPSGSTRIASFAITASIDGADAKLLFIPGSQSYSSPIQNTGARVKISLSSTNIDNTTRLGFYKVSDSGSLTFIDSWVANVPSVVLSKRIAGQSSSNDAQLNPDGTGEYEFVYNPKLNSTAASMPSSGVYWNTYSNIPDTSYSVGDLVFEGPCFAGYIHISEPSTKEILAMVSFPTDVNCVTYISNDDGVQYWVERIQAADGSTTALKVASTAANIPLLTVDMHSVKSGRCHYIVYNLRPDGGVHATDGSVLTNPYEDPSLKFGGDKLLIFKGDFKQGQHIKGRVTEAGYQVFSYRYYNGFTEFYVSYTSTGRAYIQENVLKKERWFPIETNGNRGLYEFRDTVIINIESHEDNQTVSNQKVTISGTISNPHTDKKVSNILVLKSNGKENQEIQATIKNDSIFTFDVDLFKGINAFSFTLKWKTENGTEEIIPKYELKAKGKKISAFVLNYEAQWVGTLDFTRTTTTRTLDPDTSECVSTEKFKANLNIDFKGSKLWYIKQSHENAVECSGFDNCYLFSGKNSGPVTVSVNSECKRRNCENDLPLVPMVKSDGTASLVEYMVIINVSLTPWGEGNNSTDRRYHLRVTGGAPISMNSNSSWPTGISQTYDCLSAMWNEKDFKIGPYIKVDDVNIFDFTNTVELEEYTESPNSAKTWNFSKKIISKDGLTITEYTAILTVQPQ